MKKHLITVAIVIAALACGISAQVRPEIPNPAIDMEQHLRLAAKAARHRSKLRITEDEFIKMSRESGVVILDAPSKKMFDALHVRGAINLSFPDIALDSLEQLLPDKSVKILIYCNNNFANTEGMFQNPFPTKMAPASLNLSTYISLYTYGYRNIYELGPLLDVKKTRLELVSSEQELALKD